MVRLKVLAAISIDIKHCNLQYIDGSVCRELPKKKLFKKHYTLSWRINTGVKEVVQSTWIYLPFGRGCMFRGALVLTEMVDVGDSTKYFSN